MGGILKVKAGDEWVDIPAIVGPQGVPGVQGPQGLPGPKGDPGDVQSVAGKTGAVTLDAGDVEYDDTDTYAAGSVGAGLADLKSQTSGLDKTEMDGLRHVSVWKNGTWNPTGPSLNDNNKRIRPDSFVFVNSGDVVSIKNGSYRHSVGIWKGTLASNTNVRYDSAWITVDENFYVDDDGFFIVAFSDADNNVLGPNDFDGAISITSFAYNVNQRMQSATENVNVPILRNGRINSPGNADAVTTKYIIRINKDAQSIVFEYLGDKTNIDSYELRYMLFHNASDGDTTSDAYADQSVTRLDYTISDARRYSPRIIIDLDGYEGYEHIAFELRKKNGDSYVPIRILSEPFAFAIEQVVINPNKISASVRDVYAPVLRNGSVGNVNNNNAIANEFVLPINNNADYIVFEYIGDTTNADAYGLAYSMFKGATDWQTTTSAHSDTSIVELEVDNTSIEKRSRSPRILIDLRQYNGFYDHVSFGLFKYLNGNMVQLRILNEQNVFVIKFGNYDAGSIENDDQVEHIIKQSRHTILNSSATPLTILHFSDLHGDIGALGRIMHYAEENGAIIDDVICTGDIVSNTAEQITSWWDAKAMTCIGNHDTATYTQGTGYNWTALSMADRSAYYIEPFESEWNIIHSEGKSYYYKDYQSSKVRLIVLDSMLYVGNATPTEAAAQTAWFVDLLNSAITAGLHVLIAIHSPHGGAKAVSCSFTTYTQNTMPVNTDCDTPQDIIDAVTTAKNNGLLFIGYLCGHTHIDAVWDAENDKKQNMYCVTCANVSSEGQWKAADLYRGVDADAFNLVTIDAGRRLVKIVRGGGADVNDHMKSRKGICFAYTSNNIQGELG